jgi:Ser/Thr protein kinase RdoA (MazF antagonist)
VTHREMREDAIRAAVAVADRLGMTSLVPVILRDSNHTSIHLRPFPIVARVVAPTVSQDMVPKLANELEVAQHLARAGVPIVTPSIDVLPGPHSHDGWAVTLWQFVDQRPAREDDGPVAAAALREIHGALAVYPRQLPSFMAAIDSCHRLLRDESALPELRRPDRNFLLTQYDRLRMQLSRVPTSAVAIHGDPHLGNVLMTADGPRWTDWESVCVGPLEWDLSCLPETALAVVPDVDQKLLAVLRDLRSVCVTAWCWAEPDRAPEKREAAEFHLDRLRYRCA